MNAPPEIVRKIRQWVEKAEQDFTAAERPLPLSEGGPFDAVCFHAQQCTEKHIKGSLIFRHEDRSNER